MKAAASHRTPHGVTSEEIFDAGMSRVARFPHFLNFHSKKNSSVVLTACAGRVTRAVRERSDRPRLGKHGKRKLDELHGDREDRTASEKFGAAQRHGEALGLDQRWAGRAPVRLTLDGRRDANHGPDLARLAVVGFCR
jgi:hypothetical protein